MVSLLKFDKNTDGIFSIHRIDSMLIEKHQMIDLFLFSIQQQQKRNT